MKKLHYILAPFMAAAVLVSCNTQPAGPTDAELTAQVDAKVEEVKAKLKSDCDANLRNAASMMKDSILMSAATTTAPAAAKPAPVAAKPTPKPTPKPAPAPVKPTPAPVKPTPAQVQAQAQKDRFDNNGQVKVTAEKTKEQQDRFNNNGAVKPTENKTQPNFSIIV